MGPIGGNLQSSLRSLNLDTYACLVSNDAISVSQLTTFRGWKADLRGSPVIAMAGDVPEI